MPEPKNISETVFRGRKPGTKFFNKTFADMPLRDLEWIITQPWLQDDIKANLKIYLSKTPIQRAKEKVGAQ